MKKYIFIAFILITASFTSCFEIEQFPHDTVSAKAFWKTEDHAKQNVMGIYNAMKSNNVFGMYFDFDGYSDIGFGNTEAIPKGTYTDRTGEITNKWQHTYEGIARANILLQNVDNTDMTVDKKERYKAEARFMRALYYSHLLDFYGGVPIYDETTIVAEEYMTMKKPRSSAEDVRSFILADLKFAADLLPVTWVAGDNKSDNGRATRGAAVALSGKVKLYGKDYQGAIEDFEEIVLDRDGKGYNYALYPNYADLFKQTGHDSNEMIFSIQNKGGIGTGYGMPFALYIGSRSTYGSCWNNCVPLRTMVDMYENKDGTTFNWNDHIPNFNEDMAVQKETFLATLSKGVVTKYPDRKDQLIDIYANRDPRLNESVITPYSTYLGWVSEKPKMCEFVVVPGANETYGYLRDNRGWQNYFWRKFVPEGNMNGALTDRSHVPINFPLIRYADVLLMLAECYNEMDDYDKAVERINEVRQRPSTNMPAINSGPAHMEARDKATIFERIMKERAVELACEGHRFGDLRRWELGVQKLNFKYSDLLGNARYTRVFEERDNLWPIPAVEIERNALLKPNNPGW